MTKFLQILLIACIAVAVCSAEAPRSRFRVASRYQQQRRSRVLARQEVAPVDQDAVTPYPTADELKPEVPFDEVANADAPTPVEEDVAAEEIVPVDDSLEAERQPDAIYGPPEAEADELPAQEDNDQAVEDQDSQVVDVPATAEETADEEEAIATAEEEQSQLQRLVSGRRVQARKAVRPAKLRQARPAKLVKAQRKVQRSARIQQQPLEPQAFATQPLFFYTAPYQGW